MRIVAIAIALSLLAVGGYVVSSSRSTSAGGATHPAPRSHKPPVVVGYGRIVLEHAMEDTVAGMYLLTRAQIACPREHDGDHAAVIRCLNRAYARYRPQLTRILGQIKELAGETSSNSPCHAWLEEWASDTGTGMPVAFMHLIDRYHAREMTGDALDLLSLSRRAAAVTNDTVLACRRR